MAVENILAGPREKVIHQGHIMTLHPNIQFPTSYGFQDIARMVFKVKITAGRSNQGHNMALHT